MNTFEKEDNIYMFDDMDEWIRYTGSVSTVEGTKMLSPGGFASYLGVKRSTVNNWIYRDKRIRYFRCKPSGGGEYGVIPINEAEKLNRKVDKNEKVGL